MDTTLNPAPGMFSVHVLIILGITVVLVSAVAVILYNKIQQQGEKLSAVMELSTVLAQEVRSHDASLKHLQSHRYSLPQEGIVDSRLQSSSYENNVISHSQSVETDDNTRIYVSDGSGESDDDISIHSHAHPTTLDNILMNPSFGHVPSLSIGNDELYECEEVDSGDESDEVSGSESGSESESESESDSESESESESEDERENENEDDDERENTGDTLSVMSEHIDTIDISISDNTSSEKRVITLSDISIEAVDLENDETDKDIHKVILDTGDNVIDYKKVTVNELRRIAIDQQLIDKGSKMKKPELIELLSNK